VSERFYAKRRAGLSPVRQDGSLVAVNVDRQSAAAEQFGARKFGVEFNDEVWGTHGDDGYDFTVETSRGPVRVDVVWLGFAEPYGTDRPRVSGHLIVNDEKHHPDRRADAYVVVAGTIEAGFMLLGWLAYEELEQHGKKDFGFGMKSCCPVEKLHWFRPGTVLDEPGL